MFDTDAIYKDPFVRLLAHRAVGVVGLVVEIARRREDSFPVYNDDFQQPVNTTCTYFPDTH